MDYEQLEMFQCERYKTVSDIQRASFWKGFAIGFMVAVAVFCVIGAFIP
jgi:hypothetical protein